MRWRIPISPNRSHSTTHYSESSYKQIPATNVVSPKIPKNSPELPGEDVRTRSRPVSDRPVDRFTRAPPPSLEWHDATLGTASGDSIFFVAHRETRPFRGIAAIGKRYQTSRFPPGADPSQCFNPDRAERSLQTDRCFLDRMQGMKGMDRIAQASVDRGGWGFSITATYPESRNGAQLHPVHPFHPLHPVEFFPSVVRTLSAAQHNSAVWSGLVERPLCGDDRPDPKHNVRRRSPGRLAWFAG